jgi:hypothetical protein
MLVILSKPEARATAFGCLRFRVMIALREKEFLAYLTVLS